MQDLAFSYQIKQKSTPYKKLQLDHFTLQHVFLISSSLLTPLQSGLGGPLLMLSVWKIVGVTVKLNYHIAYTNTK